MFGKLTRIAITAGAVATVGCLSLMADGQARAADPRTSRELFYNYYAPPGPCGGVATQLYVAPLPTPPLVGHTYVTYPPLMPHEWLYPHSRSYVRRNPDGGTTRTSVMWTRSLFDFGRYHHGASILPSPPLTHKAHYNASWVRNK